MTVISDYSLPPPETLIDYGDGTCIALMFYYAPEGVRFSEIAALWGFDALVYFLDDPDLQSAYDDGDTDVAARWNPAVPEGWILGGKYETEEDGIAAIFLRPTLDS